MLTAVRTALLAGLLLSPPGNPAGATQALNDTSGLHFLGFRAGAHLHELTHHLQGSGGSLRCRQARVDPRVSECRGRLPPTAELPEIELWVSAIDSVAGIMTLAGRVDATKLENWRRTLQERYGRVATRRQGTQSMLQWVRRGRMVRLTWRHERSGQVASVSLVDGHVLDGWGRARRSPK
jgi:hypothetical protein